MFVIVMTRIIFYGKTYLSVCGVKNGLTALEIAEVRASQKANPSYLSEYESVALSQEEPFEEESTLLSHHVSVEIV